MNGPPIDDEKKAFSRADRVRRRGAFRRIQNHGERTHTRHFIIVQHAGRDTTRSRLGITVTKKIGNSPERNRVKRLVREAFRLHRGLFAPGIDAVFIAKRGAPELTLAVVVSELHKAKNALQRCARRALAAASKEKAVGL